MSESSSDIQDLKDNLKGFYKSLDVDIISYYEKVDNALSQDFKYDEIKGNLWNINQVKVSLKEKGVIIEEEHPLEKYLREKGIVLNEAIDLYYTDDKVLKQRQKWRNLVLRDGIWYVYHIMKDIPFHACYIVCSDK